MALGRHREENGKFKANLVYIVSFKPIKTSKRPFSPKKMGKVGQSFALLSSWHKTLIPALRWWRQKNQEFKVILDYMAS